MVLKILLLFIFSSSLFAQNLEYLYRMEKYEDVVLETDGSEETQDLEYQALALERTGNLNAAINIYLKLIKKEFAEENKIIINAIKEKSSTIELQTDKTETLIYYFGNLANLFTKKYQSFNRGMSKRKLRALYKRAYLFISILKLIDDYGSEADILLAKLNKKRDEMSAYELKSNNYITSSIISWQDKMNFAYKDGRDKSKILNTSYGNCTGYGKVWKSDHREYFIDGCFILGFSTISKISGDLQLSDSRVSVTGGLFNIGTLFSLKSPDLAIGPSFNILSVKGNWDYPDDTELSPTQYTRYGLTFNTKWYLKRLAVISSFGRIFKNESVFFGVGIIYNL